MLDITLILLAAGNSTRFNLPCKKQNLYINKSPLWLYLAKEFEKLYKFSKIIIVCDEPCFYEVKEPNYIYVKGGKERFESIENALEKVNSQYVLITDVARAFINPNVLNELILNAKNYDCVFPAIKIVDTIYNEEKQCYLNRNELRLVQTPQLSKSSALKSANLKNFTDESSAILANNGTIKAINGDELSFKITTKNDLQKLKLLNLAKPSKDIFVGYGYDVHEFCHSNVGHKLDEDNKNEELILAGVRLGKEYALKAHSDGDVLAHAFTDALFGACGLGDIGAAFSPDDDNYHNANSMQLLKLAYDKCKSYGYELINADITICAEKPKLLKYKQEMLKNLITILKTSNINIKATTTEKLGFVGRCEGISVSVVVNMKLFDWSEYENINS
ncbi:2-C-methyl-D-erythritol 2,4-cyclodiphosphate synthase [Campylobacter sp. RM12637]|uniref:2-C-methyl-D-erythritol 2,4-cyclodiphosphate synthase n=1 Tax=Campylobacter sp. RM12637 TaxID=2735734 RepID=UPI0030150F5E|nr:2-C-methyl-D-erythritol 2,4-cyclodiphosphate synthase [Campylobacter sp. RM12637]